MLPKPERDHARTDTRTAPTAKNAHRPGTHPLQGTWASLRPDVSDTASHVWRRITLNVQLGDEELVLTQVAADAIGRHVATKMTMPFDGLEHPIPFGNDLTPLRKAATRCRRTGVHSESRHLRAKSISNGSRAVPRIVAIGLALVAVSGTTCSGRNRNGASLNAERKLIEALASRTAAS